MPNELQMTPEEAEELTQGLGQIHAGSWRVTASFIRLGLPKALGLSNDEWVKDRLGGTVRLAVDERREAAEELAAEGMSQREIAAALGVSPGTVNQDLTGVQNQTMESENSSSEPEGVQNQTPEPDSDALADEQLIADDENPENEPPQEINEDTEERHSQEDIAEFMRYAPLAKATGMLLQRQLEAKKSSSTLPIINGPLKSQYRDELLQSVALATETATNIQKYIDESEED
jgi:transcriptional regulator with XRE-family HTH domain